MHRIKHDPVHDPPYLLKPTNSFCTQNVSNMASQKRVAIVTGAAEGIGRAVVEGLAADGVLDPIQRGFSEEHGLQCGFCTAGMMMTGRALLDSVPDPTSLTDEEIREAISGQICRCTGYEKIMDAVRLAAARQEEAV